MTTNTNSKRVLRGGSWHYGPQFLRSSFRFNYDTDLRYYYLGFRLKLPTSEVLKRVNRNDKT